MSAGMTGWSVMFSPGDVTCEVCKFDIEAGYAIFQHPNWPDTWACLTCMLKDVRRFLRERELHGGVAS